MRSLHRILPLLFLLSACSSLQTGFGVPEAPQQEVLPYPTSTEELSTMMLRGTAFTMGEEVERTKEFTRSRITYNSNGLLIGGTLTMPTGDGSFPLVLLLHGWTDPRTYDAAEDLAEEQRQLAKEGFAVLHPDLRGFGASATNPRSLFDNGLAYALDAANAVVAIRTAAPKGIATEKVGLYGYSMGGSVALLLAGARPALFDAFVLASPSGPDAWGNFRLWQQAAPEQAEASLEILGTKAARRAPWEAMSATAWLERIEDPVRIFHGLRDDVIPAAWSHALVQRLESLGKDVRYTTYPKEGHAFGESWAHSMNEASVFLRFELR